MIRMTPTEQLEFSKRDLASRLGHNPAEVEVSASTMINWRSGALGYPRSGMSYTDALVQGLRIGLNVGKPICRYHASSGGQPFHCPDKWAEAPLAGQGAD